MTWVVNQIPFGATDGGTVVQRDFFPQADWLWSPIPASPTLDTDSAAMVTGLTGVGSKHQAWMADAGVAIINTQNVTPSVPRFKFQFKNVPLWGADPFTGYRVPVTTGTVIPTGTDGLMGVADPDSSQVFTVWQASLTQDNWYGSWGGRADISGDGIEQVGGSRTNKVSPYAGVIRRREIAAKDIPHALMFYTNVCHTSQYRHPAQATDGTNSATGVAPIPQGARIQLDPSLDLTAISGITQAERTIGKALQTYGAYCVGNVASASPVTMGFLFEYGGNPAAEYVTAGLTADYYDMTKIPWASLRVLKKWDGTV
jgi:hypothetical protein